jgi:MraZ protein
MASCDDQGRVILSKQLIKYAKVVKDLTIIGVLNKVEIWDKKTLIFSDKKTVIDDDSYEELSKKVTV